jgi:hypothetical protein
MIAQFFNGYRWLSNFYLAPIVIQGITYTSSEAAYQAAKTTDLEIRHQIAVMSPSQAKRYGSGKRSQLKLRPDWEDIKVDAMKYIVRQKFIQHPNLAKKLIKTGSRELIEGNTWGDTFWGVCNGVGKNMLGIILMEIRTELQLEQAA